MKRRVCETCFFYNSAGLANSGWCRHPDREFSSGVRLVVRGNEIACRNGWNVDLWVPASADSSVFENQADAASTSLDVDQITSIIPARYSSEFSASEHNDRTPITISEDVLVRHDAFPESRSEEKLARDLVTNPRAAILKAREQFKVRQLRQGRLADHSDQPILADSDLVLETYTDTVARNGRDQEFADDFAPENSHFLAVARSADLQPAVPPVTLQEMSRPFPTMTEFPEDRQRFESVPEQNRGDPVYPEPGNDRLEQPVGRIADFEDNWGEYNDENHLPLDSTFPEVAPRVRRESFVERILRERRERQAPSKDELNSTLYQQRDYAAPAQLETHFSHQSVGASTEQRHSASQPLQHDSRTTFQTGGLESVQAHDQQELESPILAPASRSGETAEVLINHQSASSEHRHESDWVDDDFILPPLQEAQSAVDRRTRTEHEEMPSRMTGPILDDDLPSWHHENRRPLTGSHRLDPVQAADDPAPGVPRICRTCRDFRSTESGERGWCNNPWAFKHRRMVDAGVLSCETSYGVWWLPSDKVWQQNADVSRHTHETPLLDQLLASQEAHALRRDRSASGGRR